MTRSRVWLCLLAVVGCSGRGQHGGGAPGSADAGRRSGSAVAVAVDAAAAVTSDAGVAASDAGADPPAVSSALCAEPAPPPVEEPRWLQLEMRDADGHVEGVYAAHVAPAEVLDVVRLTDRLESPSGARWSADGRFLAIDLAQGGIDLADFRGPAPVVRRVTDDGLFFQWAPGGRTLVVSRADEELLFDPTDLAQPVLVYASAYRPLWAPDGRRFVAVLGLGDAAALHVVDLETGLDAAVPLELDALWGMRWSPDGRFIAAAERTDGAGGLLHVLDAADGTRVASGIAINGDAVVTDNFGWAADGMLVWSTAREGELRVATVGPDGVGASARLGATPATWALSPNGRCVAHGCGSHQDGYAVCVAVLQDGVPRQLARFDSRFVGRIDWSADGSRIALRAAPGNLFMLQLDDADVSRVDIHMAVDDAQVNAVGWSADSRWFAYWHRPLDQPFVSSYLLWDAEQRAPVEFVRQADRSHSTGGGGWAPGVLAFTAYVSRSGDGYRQTVRWVRDGMLQPTVVLEDYRVATRFARWQPHTAAPR